MLHDHTIYAFTMKNNNGMEITCLNYGCIITEIIVPDKEGNFENVVVRYDTHEEYVNDILYFGAVAGRVAGRIKDEQFELDKLTYTLTKNEQNNPIHVRVKGFNRVIWNAALFEEDD